MYHSKRIGFVSTRLAGTDGVSLETRKWAEILKEEGHSCYYMAGELDTPDDVSFPVPECHFAHPDIMSVHQGCFGQIRRETAVTRKIEALKWHLKDALHAFVRRFKLDLLIPENAVTIPLNIPLGLAITEFAAETAMPMIAHNHDFFWERQRFHCNGCWDYLNKAFPPHLPRVQHVVLNSSQGNQLSLRTGISSVTIPNVMNFSSPHPEPDGYTDDLRHALGFKPGEMFILQPTRIIQRKGIERAIELVHRLGMPAKLVISHASGDEGGEYARRVLEYSALMRVEIVMCADRVGERRGMTPDGHKVYRLADLYEVADFVTYPSKMEGFGNAFLEALYFKRPILVNNYSTFNSDIRPKGFQTVEMDGYITEGVLEQVRHILANPEVGVQMAEHNYTLACQFYSYETARQKLRAMFVQAFGS